MNYLKKKMYLCNFVAMKSNQAYLYLFLISFVLASVLSYWFCLPKNLFDNPISMVLLDRNDELLGAHIASDGQWRFPPSNKVPRKFEQCIINFEDKRFYEHSGVDGIAIVRAIVQNVNSRRAVSGGSTITMQVIRLSRKGKQRTYTEKLIEMVLSSRIELQYSKKEILAMYASNAPFGGNIVGLDAASWRYFGRSPNMLSWAESAMLAVLPNSPSLIHTGRNREQLKQKRDRLLLKLLNNEIIDITTYKLALEEEIPEHPSPYPMLAQHLVARANSEIIGAKRLGKTYTTIDADLQIEVLNIANNYYKHLSKNRIFNVGILVLDNNSSEVIAYVGNTADANDKIQSSFVDMIMAKRSTGSILKPFLYSAMLSSGTIMPEELVADIPTRIGGFAPENFGLSYSGALPANKALARSLNIPAVLMLKKFGVAKFKYFLQELGLTSINRSSDDYGLSLILGGAEASLWELCGAYSSMARILINFTENNSRYFIDDIKPPTYLLKENKSYSLGKEYNFISAASIWFTFKAMIDLERPEQEGRWELFSSRQPIAWKTGTSFGFRDAWSIGVTPDYTVGVWVGNANGEGRPGIIGIKAAAPILFDVFRILPDYDKWFDPPYDELIKVNVCRKSGYPASDNCESCDSVWIPQSLSNYELCPYHKTYHLDVEENYRVHSDCYPINKMKSKSFFVLPPAIEWYYRKNHPEYKILPPFHPDCVSTTEKIMDIVYPDNLVEIFIPRNLGGQKQKIVFEAVHRNVHSVIYWHIDENYVGETTGIHTLPIEIKQGKHKLTLIDGEGNKEVRWFTVLDAPVP
jgi:penicillin-binding protein 1C